jgi:hypothetical protein
MKKLEYCFDCLDGHYSLVMEWAETLCYEIESDIAGFENRNGELSKQETEAFEEALKKAEIEKWDRAYLPETEGIEDAVHWKLKLMEDDKEYVSEGEESYEPYGYELFIDALRKAEDKADYFKAGTK